MTITSIISNVAAFSAQGNIAAASTRAAASIARLSSGNRITQASDDVSGLATGTSLRTQVTTLRTALQNASQGTSLLQVADGSLSQIVDILQRQKAIAVQAGSGSLTDANRSLLNQEFQNLSVEIDRIAVSTNFNGVVLLAGGLGAKTRQASTDALAISSIVAAPGQNTVGGAAVAASTAVQAFDLNTGGSRAGTGSSGFLQFTDSSGVVLTNSAYDNLDGSVYGQFSKFEFSNVTYGAVGTGAATLTATLNGVQYTGNVVSHATAATAILRNGNTYINVALGGVTLTDAGTQATATNNITNLFSTTVIARTSTLQGIDFEGTALDGAIGSTTNGNGSIRLFTNGQADISDFQYVSNSGVADTNTLTVQVNGKTFTASGVKDTIATANGAIQFVGAGRGEVLNINLTGLVTPIGNIRTSTADQTNFINALNQGFSKSGAGLNFTIGSRTTDNIRVQFGSATTSNIYNGQALDISSATSAANAASVLDGAITKVVSLRASVGALQSRFNFASNAIQTSIENQDAARGQLLDTDVSAESTTFASAQVQLQAGIAVLAQANQLPQSLLKLLS
ncbi:MAG: flagellin [Pseudomonadota bacterium]